MNMKKLLLLSIVVIFSTCTTKTLPDLTDQEKQTITNSIMDLTTNWAIANNNMNADKAIEFWDSSSELMYAENGKFFPNRDTIYSFIKSFYQSAKSIEIKWEQRVVIPLSINAASMSGYFHVKAVFKSGDTFEANSMFTGVFVKKNTKWVLIHGHESYK
jgi:hypothetical protein